MNKSIVLKFIFPMLCAICGIAINISVAYDQPPCGSDCLSQTCANESVNNSAGGIYGCKKRWFHSECTGTCYKCSGDVTGYHCVDVTYKLPCTGGLLHRPSAAETNTSMNRVATAWSIRIVTALLCRVSMDGTACNLYICDPNGSL